MLRKMFAAGEVNADCSPKKLHKSNSVLKEHEFANLGTKLNKLHSEYFSGDGLF